MAITVKKFSSFEEAGKSEAAYYRSLTPQKRMEILFDLIRRGNEQDETEQRFERVYRIVKLAQS